MLDRDPQQLGFSLSDRSCLSSVHEAIELANSAMVVDGAPAMLEWEMELMNIYSFEVIFPANQPQEGRRGDSQGIPHGCTQITSALELVLGDERGLIQYPQTVTWRFK